MVCQNIFSGESMIYIWKHRQLKFISNMLSVNKAYHHVNVPLCNNFHNFQKPLETKNTY